MNSALSFSSPPRIYLINVGANSAHENKAKSPLFVKAGIKRDYNFCYVPFFATGSPKVATNEYPPRCVPFLNPRHRASVARFAHVDPDWENLSYGDCCDEPRGATLKNARANDIFLFWGVLHHNTGTDWQGFEAGAKGWYLFGCLRIENVVSAKTALSLLSPEKRNRALKNIHFSRCNQLPEDDYVFLGDPIHSKLFNSAIDLRVNDEDGLIYRAFTTANGAPLSRNGRPRWFSSLRSSRIVIDLAKQDHRSRGEILRQAIKNEASFDILAEGFCSSQQQVELNCRRKRERWIGRVMRLADFAELISNMPVFKPSICFEKVYLVCVHKWQGCRW